MTDTNTYKFVGGPWDRQTRAVPKLLPVVEIINLEANQSYYEVSSIPPPLSMPYMRHTYHRMDIIRSGDLHIEYWHKTLYDIHRECQHRQETYARQLAEVRRALSRLEREISVPYPYG